MGKSEKTAACLTRESFISDCMFHGVLRAPANRRRARPCGADSSPVPVCEVLNRRKSCGEPPLRVGLVGRQ